MDLFDFADSPGAAGQEGKAGGRSASRRKTDVTGPKVFTIAQLTRKIRFLLEASMGEVWVAGEVSNVRRQASGHTYFTLKDASAQLSCVLFRGDARLARLEPENGMQLRVFGEITVYETRGQYQMIVRKLEVEGQGALQARFEALKQKLHAEGLFASDLKRPLRPFPATIALVTSPTGAAVRDVLNVVTRRAPWVRVIVVPVPVQGAGAHREIAAALARLGAAGQRGVPDIDTVILCRGGGSIEDLWNFNEEDVARAIRACPIPIISAIGHEIDFTIADFAADLRAPTPSAAAELAVPDRATLLRQIGEWQASLDARVRRKLDDWCKRIDWHGRGSLTREPERQLRECRMRLDGLAESLDQTAANAIVRARTRTSDALHLLVQLRPDRVLERRQARLGALADRLDAAVRVRVKADNQRINAASQLLRSLGPQSVFNRGFSLTTTVDGRVLTDATEIEPGSTVKTRLASGSFTSEVAETDPQS